jgi:Ca2+-transporting ATPase
MVHQLKFDTIRGLSEAEAAGRLKQEGYNELPASKKRSLWAIALEIAREPIFLLLVGCGVIYLLLGDAQEALILLGIVQSVKLGRRIFDNLKKGMAYTLAVHVPIAGMSLIPVLFQWPLVLLPVHIAFLHLIIDPACTVVFEAEPEESNVMNRPPRNPKEPLFSRRTLRLALLQGMSSLVVLVLVFAIAYYRGNGELDARALAFTTLIISNLSLILTNRSWSRTIPEMLRSPNRALWWVIGGGVVFLGLILYVPLLRVLFRFSFLHPEDLAITLIAGIFSILWFEGFKLWNRRKKRKRSLSL